jgi:branched-chain amino acid transport system substrate-binding protein
MLQHPAGKFAVHKDIEKFVSSQGKSLSKPDEIGSVLYNRGLVNSMLGTEAIRTAMAKFGNKPMTGEQVRWGIEHLDLTADRIKQLGFEGMIGPIKVSCADHEGARLSRVHQWDGKQWKIISDWYTADDASYRRWSRPRPRSTPRRRRSPPATARRRAELSTTDRASSLPLPR